MCKMAKIMIFWLFVKFYLDAIYWHPGYLGVSWGSRDHSPDHILVFQPLPAKCHTNIGEVKNSQKLSKAPFGTKNHDFFKVILSDHMADIWPEICIWDVLDTFYVLFWYIEVIWCIFGKIEKKCIFLPIFGCGPTCKFDFFSIFGQIIA